MFCDRFSVNTLMLKACIASETESKSLCCGWTDSMYLVMLGQEAMGIHLLVDSPGK